MVETRPFDVSSGAISCLGAAGNALGCRKFKTSNSSFLDKEFLRFLKDTGVLDSCDEDPSIAELFRGAPGQQHQQGLVEPQAMNDLPGVLNFQQAQQPTTDPSETRETVASQLSGLSSQLQQQAHQACATAFAQQHQQRNHRAVITAMPMPAPATRAAAAAAAAADADDDTSSAATLPMPSKRRRSDDEEVTSSPNDLVEVPSSTVVTTASGTAAATSASSRGARRSSAGDTAGAADQQGAASAAGSSRAVAAAETGVVKAILVAKVLTKSDANSKRVILPRIAVESNLPQLSHAQVFNLSATDPHGASWPLVIKAWANGQNPKPVYVLEQVGELLKQYKLTMGDALAVLASEDGRFWLEWNTAAAKAAAARPTYSAFTFKQQAQQQVQKAAAPGPSSGKGAAAAAAEQPSAAQQPEQPQPAVVKAEQQQQPAPVAAPAPQQQQLLQPAGNLQSQLAVRHQQQQPPCSTLMTAVPVTSTPLVSGTFIPTSPCQLLVLNSNTPFAPASGGQLDDPLLCASLPAAALMLKTCSDALFELQEPAAPIAAVNAAEGEALLVPVVPEAGDNGALHAGGFLLCPRTPGCTRPAGHQGWCLGHKGYKKRRV